MGDAGLFTSNEAPFHLSILRNRRRRSCFAGVFGRMLQQRYPVAHASSDIVDNGRQGQFQVPSIVDSKPNTLSFQNCQTASFAAW